MKDLFIDGVPADETLTKAVSDVGFADDEFDSIACFIEDYDELLDELEDGTVVLDKNGDPVDKFKLFDRKLNFLVKLYRDVR